MKVPRTSRWHHLRGELAREIRKANYDLSPSKFARKLIKRKGLENTKSNFDTLRLYISRLQKDLQHKDKCLVSEGEVLTNDKTSFEQGSENASWEYIGEQSLTTLEDALAFSNVDLTKWEVERWIFNSWDVSMAGGKRTNYQVKVWFKVKDNTDELAEEFRDRVDEYLKERLFKPKVKRSKNGGKVGVIPIADLHIGAFIRNLIMTKDYDVEKVIAMLDEVADEINAQKYSEVHIAIIGDVIESFTGKNHPNSFQSIGYNQTGFSIFIVAYEILEAFLSKIKNLKKVYCVSGNHDRYTASNKEDVKGEVLQGIAYFLNKHMNVEVEYNPMIINAIIDGISYIFTHGHHNFTNKNIEKIILDYGVQGMFNVVVEGHDHTRKRKDTLVRIQSIIKDTAKYRGYTCPSLFTGNFYSESMGFSSTAGFLQFWNRGGVPAALDLPLG